jgi:hypothetical protein
LRGAEIQGFIQKPISLDELGSVMQKQLKTKKVLPPLTKHKVD